MVRTMEERMANDCSLTRRAIARDLGVDASQIRKWQQQIALHLLASCTHFNPHARSLHPGMNSSLHGLEELLLRFIFEQREQGIAVDIRMVIDTAKVLDAAFRCKSDSAQYQVVHRFVAAHGLVYRVHTYVSQKSCSMMTLEAKAWIQTMRPLLVVKITVILVSFSTWIKPPYFFR
jgi:hypothetical protein